ncbi:MAG: hypothetical protein Q4B26_07040 [Eubacteriales bacterium]|nr:hypothetical protein [Eubacteriales bacterium]
MESFIMTSFHEYAQNWIQRVGSDNKKYYGAEWGYKNGDIEFPLRQHMSIETHQSILGFHTNKGRLCFGEENCYFLILEEFSEQDLLSCIKLIDDLAEQDVDFRDPRHQYTFENLVVVTQQLPEKEVVKKIKKYRLMKRYRQAKEEYGWHSGSICLVSLSDEQFVHSAYGDTLENRLARTAFDFGK